MVKIAFLSPFFWPEPISTGKYNTILAEALSANGVDVEFYCSHPLYPEWKPKAEVSQHHSVKTIRGGLSVKYSKSQVVKRLTLEFWFLLFIFKNALRRRNQYDLLVSVYPPVIFGFVSSLFMKKGKKNVVISHDIQGILASQEGSLFRKTVANIMKNIEKMVYRKADHIIFLSESMKNFCSENYGIETSKTSVFYPFEDVSKMQLTDDLKIFNNTERRIVYSGALGEKQAPDKIMKLYEMLTERDPDIHCYIFSSGPKFISLELRNTNPRIIFSDLVPLRNLRELIEKSVIQLIPQEVGTADAVLPSKLPNIISAGAGIVAITDKGNELETLLHKVEHSMIFYNWDYEKISSSVMNYLSANFTEDRAGISDKDRALFDADRLVKKLISLAYTNHD